MTQTNRGTLFGALGVVAGLAMALLHAPPVLAATFTVDSVGDEADANPGDGNCQTGGSIRACTLRAAIQEANARPGLDTIGFRITLLSQPGQDPPPATITPLTPLPTITDPVIIDGYTQPGASVNTATVGTNARLLIELNRERARAGLEISSGGSTVRGLVMNRSALIRIPQGDGNRVEGNFLGTDVTGVRVPGSMSNGVFILSSRNQIGGTSPAQRNLISGANVGIAIAVSTTTTPRQNSILGNYIGTTSAGNAALSNGVGVLADGAPLTEIGSAGGGRNVISGNRTHGVHIVGSWPQAFLGATVVYGNLIGTDGSGRNALGNGQYGVYVQAGQVVHIGEPPNLGNTIAFNGGAGIAIDQFVAGTTTGTSISGNRILSNGGLGIDLWANLGQSDGVTSNDPRDTDSGPNDLQNFPVVNSAISIGGQTGVSGTLNSTPNATFTIDVYSSPTCDLSRHGEGQTYLGTTTVTTNSNGDGTFQYRHSGRVATGQFVTATATGTSGGILRTSEFSACRMALVIS